MQVAHRPTTTTMSNDFALAATSTTQPPSAPPAPAFSAFRFRIADYEHGFPPEAVAASATQQQQQQQQQPASTSFTFSSAAQRPPSNGTAPAPMPQPHFPILLPPPMFIHDPNHHQPYYAPAVSHPVLHPLQQAQLMLEQLQPQPSASAPATKRKRKPRTVPEQSIHSANFQPASASADQQPTEPAAKKRRLIALKMSPEELKLEQARQIALRKDREAREQAQAQKGASTSAGLSTETQEADGDAPNEPELTDTEREERARLEAEAQAAEEELNKQMDAQREALMQTKLSTILAVVRGQNLPLDRFFTELCASKDTVIAYQAARTFGPKSGPAIVDAIMERRPKVYEGWLAEKAAEKAAELYAKEREKLAKALRPDQRRAMKAIVTHMKSWGLQEEMEKSAPGIWGVLKNLEDVQPPE